jgi:hypothetical protein
MTFAQLLGAASDPPANTNSCWPPLERLKGQARKTASGTEWPKISIVTPNYNYAASLDRTMQSVLLQDYPNLEYIVIDDGSTDDSVFVIKKYEKRLGYWEYQPNQGQYSAINRGFSQATGEICAWINSDDILLPWTLHAAAEIFAQFSEVKWLMGQPSQIQNGVVHNVDPASPHPREFIEAGLYNGTQLGWIQQESCFWRRSLWDTAGPLDVRYRYAADYELWTRFAAHAELHVATTLLGGFSVWEQNRSRVNYDRYAAEVQKVVENLSESARNKRETFHGELAAFERVKHVTGFRWLVRRWRNLQRHSGPVIRRNVDTASYEITRESFFR